MFTREDYLQYFREILRIEKEMQTAGLELSSHFEDPRIRELLRGLVQDEVRHAGIVEKMITLVENAGAANQN